MIADLPRRHDAGIAALERSAAPHQRLPVSLASLPPLADILRYGEARKPERPSVCRLAGAAIVVRRRWRLPYAARNLDVQAAGALVGAMRAADEAIKLAEPEPSSCDAWRNGLAAVLDGSRSTALVAGCAAHLLYEAGAPVRRSTRQT